MSTLRKLAVGLVASALGAGLCAEPRAQARAGPVLAPTVELGTLVAPLDAAVRRAVLDELSRDEHMKASTIDVTVTAGIAELSGAVPVAPWRQRASRVAGAVRGVRAVVNRIRVVAERRQDQVVLQDVRRALRDTAALRSMPIHVAVHDGVVLLTGSITSWEEQQLAERVASGVPGARFCQNQLALNRAIGRTPAIIAADIETRLDWDPLLAHQPIRVSVRARRVYLIGVIGSRAQRKRAVALAWVKGVSAVDASALRIDAALRANPNLRDAAPTDQEISTALQDLTPYWPSIVASTLRTSVVGGVVSIRGTVQTLAERDAAEAMARSAVGVVEVRNELRGPWWTSPAQSLPAPAPPRPKRKRRNR
jgi:osmotically-inducible protein OsmY